MVLPKAEAKVVFRIAPTEPWRDSVDFDPITIPVEDVHMTDVFDEGLVCLAEAIVDAECEALIPWEYMLVWSADDQPVKGTCPVCDQVFIVSEGFPHDVPDGAGPFGPRAVQCGCVDD
jgi:hypothetical protein